ncbi:Zn-dependent alcohol dehydrogenase [Anaerolineae bacterium CFX9]|nr:Zn-dependent alcohol dehydrogenase [Anaerolineae bacterium CFX9]
MHIKAALLRGANLPFEVTTLDLEPPGTGEVRVRIAASGVCHSDWHLVTGTTRHPMPCVAGHEGAGIVEEVGAGVNHLKPGDHVCLSWTPACGDCFYCQHGKPNLCDTFTAPIWDGVMLDGTPRLHTLNGENVYHYCGLATHAEQIVAPEQACVKIRPDVPLEIAALVGCAVATGVGSVLYTAAVCPAESVAVIGCGGVGLNILLGAALAGAWPIIAADSSPEKLALAKDFGATHTVASDERTAAHIRELTGGRGADHVFEAVGLPQLQELALDCARPGGQIILVGLSPMGSATNLPGAVITRTEKVVKGSYYGSVNPPRDFPLMLDLFVAGKLPLNRLITQRYSLEQINEAYAAMLTGKVARGVIVFG